MRKRPFVKGFFYEFARRRANSFRWQTIVQSSRNSSPKYACEALLTFVSNITDRCQQHCRPTSAMQKNAKSENSLWAFSGLLRIFAAITINRNKNMNLTEHKDTEAQKAVCKEKLCAFVSLCSI